MTKKELLEELAAQIEVHGEDAVIFELETEDGVGSLIISDVKYEDDRVKVTFV